MMRKQTYQKTVTAEKRSRFRLFCCQIFPWKLTFQFNKFTSNIIALSYYLPVGFGNLLVFTQALYIPSMHRKQK